MQSTIAGEQDSSMLKVQRVATVLVQLQHVGSATAADVHGGISEKCQMSLQWASDILQRRRHHIVHNRGKKLDITFLVESCNVQQRDISSRPQGSNCILFTTNGTE
jgi:hypothetical protein